MDVITPPPSKRMSCVFASLNIALRFAARAHETHDTCDLDVRGARGRSLGRRNSTLIGENVDLPADVQTRSRRDSDVTTAAAWNIRERSEELILAVDIPHTGRCWTASVTRVWRQGATRSTRTGRILARRRALRPGRTRHGNEREHHEKAPKKPEA